MFECVYVCFNLYLLCTSSVMNKKSNKFPSNVEANKLDNMLKYMLTMINMICFWDLKNSNGLHGTRCSMPLENTFLSTYTIKRMANSIYSYIPRFYRTVCIFWKGWLPTSHLVAILHITYILYIGTAYIEGFSPSLSLIQKRPNMYFVCHCHCLLLISCLMVIFYSFLLFSSQGKYLLIPFSLKQCVLPNYRHIQPIRFVEEPSCCVLPSKYVSQCIQYTCYYNWFLLWCQCAVSN